MLFYVIKTSLELYICLRNNLMYQERNCMSDPLIRYNEAMLPMLELLPIEDPQPTFLANKK